MQIWKSNLGFPEKRFVNCNFFSRMAKNVYGMVSENLSFYDSKRARKVSKTAIWSVTWNVLWIHVKQNVWQWWSYDIFRYFVTNPFINLTMYMNVTENFYRIGCYANTLRSIIGTEEYNKRYWSFKAFNEASKLFSISWNGNVEELSYFSSSSMKSSLQSAENSIFGYEGTSRYYIIEKWRILPWCSVIFGRPSLLPPMGLRNIWTYLKGLVPRFSRFLTPPFFVNEA